MSFAVDLLGAATPTRLLCRRGTWILELVRFVPVERNVFQPRTQRLEGSEAILQHLKRGDNASLSASAQQSIRGLRSDEEHSLDLVDGEWVPGAPGTRESSRPSAAPRTVRATDGLLELRAEVLMLRGSHERLRERVVRLESTLMGLTDAPRSGAQGLSASPLALPVATPERDRAREPIAHATSEGPARMMLPPVAAIDACLRTLLGDRATSAREKKPVNFSPKNDDRYWMSPLIDDDGVEAGMLVSDLQATATLGGILMMLPDEQIKAQCAARAPSEDAIAAMSEVANTLSATVNQQEGAIRVRVRPIQVMTPGSLDWAKTGTHRMELELAGAGRLFLFSH